MTAADVRDALRRRHSATQHMGSRIIHGAWTTLEEYRGIDLLAISAHASPSSGRVRGVRYPRVGYEVKVSRSDYRRELLAPSKRSANVAWCNAFYFAVPSGLLATDELAFVPPIADSDAVTRVPCIHAGSRRAYGHGRDREQLRPCYKGTRDGALIGPLPEWQRYRPHVAYPCDGCGGKGYGEKSIAEREWPTLWVPPDVGLIEVDGRGCRVTRPSPVRKDVPGVGSGFPLADLVRWISVRPDPRHLELLERSAA